MEWKLSLALIAFVLSFTPILAPIHELGHVSAAQDQNCSGRVVAWALTQTDCPEVGLVRLYGFWIELSIGMLFAWFGFNSKVGWAAMGYMTGMYLFAFASSDLNTADLRLVWGVSAGIPLAVTWAAYLLRIAWLRGEERDALYSAPQD